jgi:hypothetical protein
LLLVLLLLPCKIPMLGPLFYGVLFPAASVAAGLLLLVLFGVLLPLAAPCIWNGSDVAATVATLAVLIRHHLPSLLFQVLLLTVLGLAVGVIAGAVAFGGAGVVASLSQLVLDVGDDAPVWGMATMAGDGYAKAFSFAMMVVTLIAVLPALLVVMKGMVIIHRDAVDDLDVDAAAHEFRQSLNGLGARLRAMRQSLPARQRTVTGGADAPRVCPNAECGKVAGPDELFCTACGERLK